MGIPVMIVRPARLLVLVGLWILNSHDSISSASDLLIEGVTVVSPERVGLGRDVSVYILDGRIAEISKHPSQQAQQAAKSVDGHGLFLAPGMIDGHTHLDEIPGMILDHEEAYPEIARQARAQIPRSYLYYGFTTVVDLNARPETIEKWNSREDRPRAYFCGAAPVFDGYPTVWLPQPARYRIVPYFLFDASRAADFPSGFEPEDHTPRAVVDRMHQDGATCVKTHFERGFGGRGDMPVPTVEVIRELVEAAHEKGMPVLLHANSEEAQAFGVETKVDVLAHGMWTWENKETTDPTAGVTQVLDSIVENKIGMQPTIQVLFGERDLFDPSFLSNPLLGDAVPPGLIEWYRTTEEGGWWRGRLENIPGVAKLLAGGRWEEIDAEPITRAKNALRYLAKRDGRLYFGSDTPSDPTYANPPGLNGRLEMNNWIDAGVSLEQLFKAVTSENAKLFGLAEDLGTVETGKTANLLLMRRNPLESVEAYDSIESVILEGRIIARSELSARQQGN